MATIQFPQKKRSMRMAENIDSVTSCESHQISSLPSLCTTSFSKEDFSCKWVINDAENTLLKTSKSMESPCLGSFKEIGNNFTLQVQWTRDTCDEMLLGELSVTLKLEPAKSILFSDLYFLITDCFSRKKVKLKDKALQPKYSRSSMGKHYESCSLKESIPIPENEPIENFLHNGALTIQVIATITDMSPKQSIIRSSAIPDHGFSAKMNSMYQDGTFTDLTIVVGDKTFKVHKVVLGCQSDVFKIMLESDMKEKKESVVEIPDIAPEVMEDLLAYFYTGSSPNIKKLAKELLIVADKYNIPRLRLMCENELKVGLTVETVTSILLLADKVQQDSGSSLKKSCIEFIKQHFSSVQQSEDWTENIDELSRDLLYKLVL